MKLRLFIGTLIGQFLLIANLISQTRCLSVPQSIQHVHERQLMADTLLSIPIVIHNLYLNDQQRITESQIQAQLFTINHDFQRKNRDTIHTPAVFRNVAADAKIQFCLAKLDPLGNPTSGVQWIETNRPEIGFGEDYFKTFQGGQTIWDPSRYLNVWVCEISAAGSIAGFAIIPTQQLKENEGIVIDYRFFGSGGTSLAPYDGGRTLTHELGHWFGLNHIWGDSASCIADDGLTDTPNQFFSYDGCPSRPQISCETEDMFMNFMDLTDDACMNLFTEEQKAVMRNRVLSVRPDLLSSNACRVTTASAQFDAVKQLKLFPNPAEHTLFWRHEAEDFLLRILDVNGVQMFHGHASSSLDIQYLNPGFYLVSAICSEEMYYGSFVKL